MCRKVTNNFIIIKNLLQIDVTVNIIGITLTNNNIINKFINCFLKFICRVMLTSAFRTIVNKLFQKGFDITFMENRKNC